MGGKGGNLRRGFSDIPHLLSIKECQQSISLILGALASGHICSNNEDSCYTWTGAFYNTHKYYAPTPAHAHTLMCVHTHTRMLAHLHTCTLMHTCTHTHAMHTHMHKHTHI